MGRSISALAGLCAFALLSGCMRDTQRATPVSAAASDFETAPAPRPLALSRFDLPLLYDFTTVLDIVERVVPTTFGSLDDLHAVNGDDRKKYAYFATRGPFTAWANGTEVHLRATLQYAARGWYKPPLGPTLSAGCGDDSTQRPRIVVEMVTPLTLTANWHLQSHVRVLPLQPASSETRDRCLVSLIHYDVTDRVVDAAQHALAGQTRKIDSKIGTVDLTGKVTGWWRLLNKPIHLADSVWLVLHPEQLRLGEVRGQDHQLLLQTGLDARPRIVTGVAPNDTVPPLPPLAHDTVGNGFHIVLEGMIDYATANRALTAALVNKSVTQAGHTVLVRAVTMSPATKGRLLLAVSFVGDAQGTLQFVGTPKYDAGTGFMSVPDLDYDLEVDNPLITAYAWLRSDAVRDLMREKAQVPVTPVLDRGKELLTKGLNRRLGDAVTLAAHVDSVGVRSLYVLQHGVLIRAEAMGAAGMAVRQRR